MRNATPAVFVGLATILGFIGAGLGRMKLSEPYVGLVLVLGLARLCYWGLESARRQSNQREATKLIVVHRTVTNTSERQSGGKRSLAAVIGGHSRGF